MPKLNLKTANSIKSSFGNILKLKGVGYSWSKPDTDIFSQMYGTGIGQIPLHLRPENVVLDANNNVTDVINQGGTGNYFNATIVGNPVTVSDGGLLISNAALRLNNPADMHGVRVFIALYRTVGQQPWFGGALANANGAGSPVVSIRFPHGNTGESYVSGLSAQLLGPIPRLTGAWALIEWEIQSNQTRLVFNGTEVTPVSGIASPRLITDIGRHPNGTSTPHWGGRIGDIVFLNTDGSAEMDSISTVIRNNMANKYGITLS